MTTKYNRSIFWLRRDLRLYDNAGLYHALKNSKEVIPIFIFDKNILDKLENKADSRVEYIHNTIKEMKDELALKGSDLRVYCGFPEDVYKDVLEEYKPNAVYVNRDYEVYAKDRDDSVKTICNKQGIDFHTYKDHVIFESNEVRKNDGEPYVVFTPYKRKWLEKLNSRGLQQSSYFFKEYPNDKYSEAYAQMDKSPLISLRDMGFQSGAFAIPPEEVGQNVIKDYDKNRDFPAIAGTSKLGIHYRFGKISIREKARKAIGLNEVYLSELIWRDFYSSILDAFPHVEENAFRAKYDRIEWRNNEDEFQAWCAGKTGYPMVDAGMRELNQTGFMHNRVRMVVASFLTKHLLIDWRWGETYFAEKLLDFDLASNVGGWQWAAGCGTDAAPYFRIFNPTSQMDKFDKKKEYISKWVPEYGTSDYITPIVDHKLARARCLETYKSALN